MLMFSKSSVALERSPTVRSAKSGAVMTSGGAPDEMRRWLVLRSEVDRHIENHHSGMYGRLLKRPIDMIISSLALIVLSPLFVVAALLVKCTSRGPAFYWQTRVGRGGRFFRIVKFRSMIADADKKGPDITSSGDPRVTSVGSVFRKLKIDELPQLWNVLAGDMSLVGPRPELPRYVLDYSQEELGVLCVRPGITDTASIRYRHEEEILARSGDPEEYYRNVVLRHKLALNLEYMRNMSFWYDARMVLQTIRCLFV